MIFEPAIAAIQKHIDHYWVLDHAAITAMNSPLMYAYPGVTPDMIIVLDGHFTMTYLGKTYRSDQSMLFSFIQEQLHIDLSSLKKCIIVKFKSRALSSLMPFVQKDAKSLMRDAVAPVEYFFGLEIIHFIAHLRTLDDIEIATALDDWFFQHYNKEAEGFVVEMAQEVSASFDIRTIMEATNYSYSTIERYFKRDTGLTPKRFQSLQRYKLAVRELYVTRNSDWQHYVAKYGYYDQSHFIKEIKRYTSHTPAQLLNTPAFIQVRPSYL
ncbi:AraC family transcriptional regulator [Dokdonia sinensis]|uniref:AraC family transcriptional regulator n=1 Tax=Dokdonia sinensis TaxID=2479847 RepID=A0A3M0G9Q9_9FLAO|nr:AraC family transcriptional regulator [Dokdonia sinensis]RMB60987.1 AraC family transcriptional regulator [Dokdonia sinensis]